MSKNQDYIQGKIREVMLRFKSAEDTPENRQKLSDQLSGIFSEWFDLQPGDVSCDFLEEGVVINLSDRIREWLVAWLKIE